MNSMNVQQAIAEALAEEMRLDLRVVMFGEGVATKRPELVAEFGAERVRNTPLAEAIIAGTPSAPQRRACARWSTCSSRRS
jgi:pyruvate dehydrogenase E1 component beta subunit